MSFFKKLFSSGNEKTKPQVLIESQSPLCPITAVVEQDERVAYFYLWGDKNTNFGVKSCWIRNLVHAPQTLETDLIKKRNPTLTHSILL